MNVKKFRIQNPHTGHSESTEFVTTAGIVAISRQLWADGVRNANLSYFIAWLNALGHEPSETEFDAFQRSIGIVSRNVAGRIVEDRN